MNTLDLPRIFQHALKEIDLETFKGARELFFHPNIPTFLANRVKGEYSIPAQETVLMYRDMGFVADYPAGSVITDKAIYIQNHDKQPTVNRLAWEDYKDVALDLENHTFVLVHKLDKYASIDLEYFCPQPKFYKVFGCAILPCICRIFLINNLVDPSQIDTEGFINNFPPLDNLCVTDIEAWIRDQIAARERLMAQNQEQQKAQEQTAAASKTQPTPQPAQQPAPQPKQQPAQQSKQQPAQQTKKGGGSRWGKWALGLLAGAAAVAGVVAATSKKGNNPTNAQRQSKYPPGTRLPNSQIVDKDGLVFCPKCTGFPMYPPCPLCGGRTRVPPEISIQYCNQMMAAYGMDPAAGAASMMQDLLMGRGMSMGGGGGSSSANSRRCTACAGTGRCGFCGGRGWKRILNSQVDCDMCHGGGRCQNCMGRGTI